MRTQLTLRLFLFKLLLGALMTACAGATEQDQSPTPSPRETQPQLQDPAVTITVIPTITLTGEAIMPSNSPTPETLSENPLVRQTKDDLAQRLNVPVEEIELLQYKEVIWPDASLGCPQPGVDYAQVITPGNRITLEVKGQKYDYHTDTSRYVFLCEMKEAPVEPVPLMPVAPHDKPSKCKQTPCP